MRVGSGTIPPTQYVTVVGTEISIAAQGYSDGEPSFNWSVTAAGEDASYSLYEQQDSDPWGISTIKFKALGPGKYSTHVDMGTASGDGPVYYAIDCDLAADGVSEDDEEAPGLFVAANGPRHRLSLNVGYHSLDHMSARLTPYGYQIWSAEEGGQLLYDPMTPPNGHTYLEWANSPGDGDSNFDMPSEVWLQATAPSEFVPGWPVTLQFTGYVHRGGGDPIHYNGEGCSDTVNVTSVGVDLQLAATAEEEEEDPGVFLGLNSDDDDDDGVVDYEDSEVTGEDDLVALVLERPLPTGLPGTDEVTLTWTNVDKVGVYEGADKSDPVTAGAAYALSALPKTVHVEGKEASDSLKDVTFTLSYAKAGSTMEDVVKATVYETGLKSVTFLPPGGGGFHDVCVDTTGEAYGTPHWEDNSDSAQNKGYLDGDAEDWDANPADHQYPVCYEKNKKVKVEVLFLANPKDAFDGAKVHGAGTLTFQETAAQFVQQGDKWYVKAQTESSGTLVNTVYHYQPFRELWTLASDSGRGCAVSSDNEVFVTLTTPLQGVTLYRTVAYLACHNGGATDADAALAHTWAMFSTGSGEDERPADVKGWNEATQSYNRQLYYWLVDPGDEHGDEVANNTTQLLQFQNGNGNCLSWVDIFHQSLLANQVGDVYPVQVLPDVSVGIVGGYNPKFIVGNVRWDDADPDYPGSAPWVYSDLDVFTDETGIPGQNTPTPARKIFEYHFVTRRVIVVNPETNRYYDPSYGITAQTESGYTSKAIVGWGRYFPLDGAYHYRKVNGTEHIVFNHIQW